MSTRTKVFLSGLAFVLIGATCPTSDCACPPARTAARLFGRVVANAQAVAGATVRMATSFDATCGTPMPLDPSQVVTDSLGRFAVTVLSPFGPGVQCVRLTVFRLVAQQLDSLVPPPLLVTFRIEGPLTDSTGVVLTFP